MKTACAICAKTQQAVFELLRDAAQRQCGQGTQGRGGKTDQAALASSGW